jgi:hypothetical protein
MCILVSVSRSFRFDKCATVSVRTGVSAVFMGQQRQASSGYTEWGRGTGRERTIRLEKSPGQIAAALPDIVIGVPDTFLRSLQE